MPSVRLRLLQWLLVPILLLNLAGVALSYGLAWLPAQAAFDQGLADAAAQLAAHLAPGPRLQLPPAAERTLRSDGVDQLYFAVRDGAGRLLAGDAQVPLLAARPAAPAQDAVVAGQPVRMAALSVEADGVPLQVTVARTLRKRDQARQAIVNALLPLAALFTLASVGLIWFSVTNGLRPLERVRRDLLARDPEDAAPIAGAAVPAELEPLVQAFNGLLQRVRDGAQAQQDFLANVAHQLRTPLAGLRTQLDWLAQHHRQPDTAPSLALMQDSTERMIRQVNQLLALARAEPRRLAQGRRAPLALDRLLEESIQQFVEQALRKEIDLGFDLRPTQVQGDRFLLRDLVDNLVDNALRYTPAHGTVTVSCFPHLGGSLLTVEDSGPGIPPARRADVFQRFARLDDKTTGSGLGLAIVRDIATAHGASVAIDTPTSGRGALFSVYFPPA